MNNSLSHAAASTSDTASATTRRQWLAVIAVAISAFAFVTSEFLPVGLLPQIARDLGVTPGTAGLMITMPGILAAISAPALMILAGRMDRRHVFMLLTAALLVSNLICATSTHFAAMLIGRAMLGAALGGFWTLATAAAGRLVQPADATKAMGTILTGVMCATVAGVPLGTFIASFASWRASFYVTGALVAIALALQAWLTPSLPSETALRFGAFVDVLRRPFARLSLLMIALVFGAHFSTYTYIAPWLQEDFSVRAMTLLLLAFGVAGFVANTVFSTLIAGRLKGSITAMMLLLLGALASMAWFDHSRVGDSVAMLVWGAAFGALPLCCSVWIQRGIADAAEAGSALFICVVQIAIAVGSCVGGGIVDTAGTRVDFVFGGVLVLFALVMLLRLVALERLRTKTRASIALCRDGCA
ncbi:MFS transporter [Pararobbsia silviterrae]|uniref:MFS transporter n=1 Tax=Pararobbsia silviterrae TaxID=1792498 RepID=A0A494XSD4_9BURK|nr:MFS transporter [Pararobbsia silviterrae]RKP53552.1 MFS transporter [Pararobbsia silviterrae]